MLRFRTGRQVQDRQVSFPTTIAFLFPLTSHPTAAEQNDAIAQALRALNSFYPAPAAVADVGESQIQKRNASA
jgi:hypothetical protein